ncbi:MAG: IclR family transcriptional regulator [Rubrivivax sp.]
MNSKQAAQAGPPELRTGTQSIERSIAILRAIASRGRRGMRISEIVSTAGLPQATCSRMLQCLLREGLLDRDEHTGKLFVGPVISELSLVARSRYRLCELSDGILLELADATQDTVYLSERSGLEAVCTARALGEFPIKVLALDLGIRRPLGVGAGGLALLAAMDPEESDAVVRAIGSHYEGHGHLHVEYMLETIERTRTEGYSFVESVMTPGTAAVGVVVPGERVNAAISVSAINSRMGAERRGEVARLIEQHARKIAEIVREMHGLT